MNNEKNLTEILREILSITESEWGKPEPRKTKITFTASRGNVSADGEMILADGEYMLIISPEGIKVKSK